MPAGDHLAIDVQGRTVIVGGEVESVNIIDEIVGMIGDVPGVDDVVDELTVTGI